MQSIVAAEIGNERRRCEYFQYALLMDLANVAGNVSDGVHIASAAGVWHALVFGFGGVRDYDGELSLAPHVPAPWRSLAFSLRFRDRQLRVALTHDEERYLVEEGDPLDVKIRGEAHVLRPGQPLVLAVAAPVATGPQVSELVRVEHRVQARDAALGDVDAEDVDEPPVGRRRAEAGLAVDDAPARARRPSSSALAVERRQRRAATARRRPSAAGSTRALPPPSPTSTASGASSATRPSRSPSRAAARKRAASASRSAGSGSKRGRSSSTRRRARLRIWRQLAGTLPSDLGDLGELVVERLAQHEHGALVRREALEQHEERERDRLLVLDARGASSSTSGSGSHAPV